jgi:DNA-directed RNA polymerase specialized sigma24 family protein
MFDMLLRWLDPDRDTAAKKYEEIRLKLTRFFIRREWPLIMAEELVEETIKRVSCKVPQLIDTYTGNPLLYFYGVARNVHLEFLRKKNNPLPPPPPEPDERSEIRSVCLEECLNRLDAEERDLILRYYSYEENCKIPHRKKQAEDLGIEMDTLRMRAYRIKKRLRKCVGDCLKNHEEP